MKHEICTFKNKKTVNNDYFERAYYSHFCIKKEERK